MGDRPQGLHQAGFQPIAVNRLPKTRYLLPLLETGF